MKHNNKALKAFKYLGTASLLFASTEAMAAGINLIANGAKMAGVGGAGIAVSFDPTSATGNPATLARLKNEMSFHPGLAHQKQKSDTSQAFLTGPGFLSLLRNRGPVHNHDKLIPGAYGGFSYNINQAWTCGVSVNGNINAVNYKHSIITPFRATPSKAKSFLALLNNNLAYKVSPTFSVGGALIIGGLTFKGNQTIFPTSTVTSGAGKTDHAFGIGGRAGLQWTPTPMVDLGLAVTSPIFFGKLKKYSDVFHRRTKTPWTITGGASVHFTKQTDLIMDLIGEFWNSTSNFGPKPTEGFGWRNTYEIKVGIQHYCTEQLPVRIGYRYAPTVVRNNAILFNTFFAPAQWTEHAVTAGLSYLPNPVWTIDFALIHRFQKSFTDNGTGTAGFAARGVKLSGQETAGVVGINYKL